MFIFQFSEERIKEIRDWKLEIRDYKLEIRN